MLIDIEKNIRCLTNGQDDIYSMMDYGNLCKLIGYLKVYFRNFKDTFFLINWVSKESDIIEAKNNTYKLTILLWMSDELKLFPSERVISTYNFIFKAYLGEDYPERRVYSWQLITNSFVPRLEVIPFDDRKVNIFYSGNLNMNRLSLYGALNPKLGWLEKLVVWYCKNNFRGARFVFSLYYKGRTYNFSNLFSSSIIRFNNGFSKGMQPEEYAAVLADSKIVLSPKGFHSPECFRLYEAMRQGCIVITEELPDVPFYREIPAIQVKDWSNINTVIKDVLSDKIEMKRLSAKAILYYDERLSPEAMAKYINKIVNESH